MKVLIIITIDKLANKRSHQQESNCRSTLFADSLFSANVVIYYAYNHNNIIKTTLLPFRAEEQEYIRSYHINIKCLQFEPHLIMAVNLLYMCIFVVTRIYVAVNII